MEALSVLVISVVPGDAKSLCLGSNGYNLIFVYNSDLKRFGVL